MIARYRKAFAVGLLTMAANSNAFDGIEHEKISDSAMLLAAAYWANQNLDFTLGGPKDLCIYLNERFDRDSVVTLVRHCPAIVAEHDEQVGDSQSEEADVTPHLPPEDAITYGGIVRVVDEMIYPSQIFVREGTVSSTAQSGSQEPEESASRFFARSYLDLNHRFHERREKRRLSRPTNATLEIARALSYNEVHFQNDLLQQMYRFRREARFAPEDELYFALVSNALSDHFLQDYLAPGHILWPRNHSHDSVAISVHDGTNQKGTWFRVNDNINDIPYTELGDFMTSLSAESVERKKLEAYWLKRRRGAEVDCAVNYEVDDEELAGDIDEGWQCLQQALSGDQHIRLYGDGLVSKSPAQQALMVLVQAQRIYELLVPHLKGPAPFETVLTMDSETGYDRIESFDEQYSSLLVPCTGLEFGEYRFNDSLECSPEYRESSQAFEDTASGVFLFNIGGQTPIDNVGSSRRQLSLEFLPLGALANSTRFRNAAIHKPPEHCKTWSLCNTGFVFGIDHIADDQFTALGGGLRGIKSFPSINLQFSLYAKYLNYDYLQTDAWKTSYGLRTDWGFSIGSLYLSIGEEYFVNQSNDLRTTGTISFGFAVGLPKSRIRKWMSDNRNYLPEDDY